MISNNAMAIALAVSVAGPAMAQDAPEQPPEPAAQEDTAAEATEPGNEIVVTGKFIDPGTRSAMKMDLAVLDTPFTVASYSEAFVESLETTNVADLYNYMTGVKKAGNT